MAEKPYRFVWVRYSNVYHRTNSLGLPRCGILSRWVKSNPWGPVYWGDEPPPEMDLCGRCARRKED